MSKKISRGKETMWNLVNSGLAGALVFLGAFTAGNVTLASIGAAIASAFAVAATQFKRYWETKESEYRSPQRTRFFNIVG